MMVTFVSTSTRVLVLIIHFITIIINTVWQCVSTSIIIIIIIIIISIQTAITRAIELTREGGQGTMSGEWCTAAERLAPQIIKIVRIDNDRDV